MTLKTDVSSDGKTMTIAIDGKFDFNIYKIFRSSTENLPETINMFILDFRNTLYIDSSALGMLLVLKEQGKNSNAIIKIINCNPAIREILQVSNFQKIFDIQ